MKFLSLQRVYQKVNQHQLKITISSIDTQTEGCWNAVLSYLIGQDVIGDASHRSTCRVNSLSFAHCESNLTGSLSKLELKSMYFSGFCAKGWHFEGNSGELTPASVKVSPVSISFKKIPKNFKSACYILLLLVQLYTMWALRNNSEIVYFWMNDQKFFSLQEDYLFTNQVEFLAIRKLFQIA